MSKTNPVSELAFSIYRDLLEVADCKCLQCRNRLKKESIATAERISESVDKAITIKSLLDNDTVESLFNGDTDTGKTHVYNLQSDAVFGMIIDVIEFKPDNENANIAYAFEFDGENRVLKLIIQER